jgi:hypothetical protein
MGLVTKLLKSLNPIVHYLKNTYRYKHSVVLSLEFSTDYYNIAQKKLFSKDLVIWQNHAYFFISHRIDWR